MEENPSPGRKTQPIKKKVEKGLFEELVPKGRLILPSGNRNGQKIMESTLRHQMSLV